MGKDATGKKDSDSPTKEMYTWRDDYGAFIPKFKCFLRTIKAFRPYDNFIFLQNYVQNTFRADE
jgi:hypothetical protein